MNLSPADHRALRRYYLCLYYISLARAAYHGVCAQFWRGVLAVLCGVEWALVRKSELRARWSGRARRGRIGR